MHPVHASVFEECLNRIRDTGMYRTLDLPGEILRAVRPHKMSTQGL